MKKHLTPSRNFIQLMKLVSGTVALCIFTAATAFGQCSLNCNTSVAVALGPDCSAVIEPDDILEGTLLPECAPYTVNVIATGSNMVTGAQLGQTLMVSVTNGAGNVCMGSITVLDEINPTIQCQSVTISCFDDPDAVAAPTASDNCGSIASLTFTETEQDLGCGGQGLYKVITRTYTATDPSGNSSSCDQVINVTRPSINDVVFPVNLDDIDAPSLDCVNPNTSTSNTGVPTISGVPVHNTCDFAADFEDQVIPICQNSLKILREWTIHDWCTGQILVQTQIIKIVDTTGPTINCQQTFTVSTQQNDCFASFGLPIVQVSDNCSSNNNITVSTTISAGTIVGTAVFNVPIGQHTLTYTATDDCGNSSTCVTTVIVEDQVAPVAICESNHVVALNSPSGATLVGALVFDDGSYDNCSDLIYEVRRMDAAHCPGNDGTTFGPFAPFFCCDVGNSVMVELRVTDAAGNSNSCMVETTVQDELNPIITCPANVTLDCNDDYTDLSLTGEPTVVDNCGATVSFQDFVNLDQCGAGFVNRTWTAVDDSGNSASCLQTIYFENSTPFYINDTECNNADPNDGVIWPCDYETNTCGAGLDPSITGEPTIFEDFCDLVGYEYDDTYLPIADPACVKILRKWYVFDWCTYDENSTDGYWEYVQIIKVLNSEDPVILSDCEDVEFCSFDEDCEDGPADLVLLANDDCTDSLELNYSYVIDAFNNGSDDIFGSTNDASGDYPLGTHRITWTVEDGCGNFSTCSYLFTIRDCKKPTPLAFNGLAIDIMPVLQMVEVQAVDFDAGSTDNCGVAEFRIASPSGGPGQTTPPPFPSSSVTFTCDDIGTNTVDLWVQDVNGNWDYVSTYIIVQDNMGACGGPDASISGAIADELNTGLSQVQVNLEGEAPGIPSSTLTNDDGEYSLTNLPPNFNYIVTPEHNIDHLNGVSTFDIVLIQQHILGLGELDSPYKKIAADINNSASISGLDIVDLRRLVLYIDTEFQDNSSWRFVLADYDFGPGNDPFASSFPEVFTVNELVDSEIADFVAVKIGDVNNSAATNPFSGAGDDRSEGRVDFQIEDQTLKAGEQYVIPVRAKDFQEVLAFQGTFNFDPSILVFEGIEAAALSNMSESNFGLAMTNEGVITTSWNDAQPINLDQETVLFNLVFRAQADAQLSQTLALNSRYTPAAAFNQTGAMNLGLQFSDSEATISEVILFQNEPNPFDAFTNIRFSLPETTNTVSRIYDINGRVVWQQRQVLDAGTHQYTIQQSDLPASGIYYFELSTAQQNLMKKLVHVRSKE